MLRFPTWKVALILGICALGLVLSLPNLFPRAELERLPGWLPHNQINLGLDLQGGSHLLLEVDLDAVVEERLDTLVDDIRGVLRPARIGYRGLGVHGDAVALTLTSPAMPPRRSSCWGSSTPIRWPGSSRWSRGTAAGSTSA